MREMLDARIERSPGVCGGKPRLAGTRIRVQDVAVWHVKLGLTADEIADEHPSVGLSALHAALAYYYEHREEIERFISEERAHVAELKQRQRSKVAGKQGDRGLTERIRFYLDDQAAAAIARGLRRRGIDVLTALEAGKCAAADEEQLEFASKEGRVFFTQDDSFLEINATGRRHSGIVYESQETSASSIIKGLALIHEVSRRK